MSAICYIIAFLIIILFPGLLPAQTGLLLKTTGLNVNDASVPEVIRRISEMTGIDFAYNPLILDSDRKVSVNINDASIDSILSLALNDASILAKEVEGQIVLCRRSDILPASSFPVAGTVLFKETMEPVPYASVVLKTRNAGMVCNEEGKFRLDLEWKFLNDTLIISSLGYKTLECPVEYLRKSKEIIILLQDSVYLIDEVTAFSYDYIAPMFWTGRDEKKERFVLTFATREKQNVLNYINFVKELYGKPGDGDNVLHWKRIDIPGTTKKRLSVRLKYFRCNYCPEGNEYNVTIEITDRRNRNLLYGRADQKALTSWFQNLLNKSVAQGVDFSQLSDETGISKKLSSGEPYSGGCYSFYPGGQRQKEGYYELGRKEGTWTWWFANGREGKKMSYKNGKPDGEAIYRYDNGQLKFIINYCNGQRDGILVYWYPDGQKRLEANYSDDCLDGIYRLWYDNGRPAKEALFKKGAPVSATEWNKKGKIISRF